MRNRKCSKCASKNLAFIELWKGGAIYWQQGDSLDDGIHEEGEPYAVEAECNDCQHRWRLRGLIQMSEELLTVA